MGDPVIIVKRPRLLDDPANPNGTGPDRTVTITLRRLAYLTGIVAVVSFALGAIFL
jgi:hypothetical protein